MVIALGLTACGSEDVGGPSSSSDSATATPSTEPPETTPQSSTTPAATTDPTTPRTSVVTSTAAPSTAVAGTGVDTTTADKARGPFDPAARLRPELMVIEPPSAAAGSTVEVRYPDETGRGVAFTLERAHENDWVLEYYLTSGVDGYGDGTPHWVPWDADDHGWDDIGIGGPGPDLIAIPPTAEPGNYRICTANAGDNFCSELNVLADTQSR